VIDAQRLIAWLRNDTFEVDSASRGETDLAYRRGWNACAHHVETVVIPRVQAEQRINDCLTELCGEQG
jgi:hypothetical protein